MRVVSDLIELQRDRRTVLTIGAFDGVHRGHQYLISSLVERADELGFASMVITFEPRPQVVLRPGSTQLTDGPAKSRLIDPLNPDTLLIYPFTVETSKIPAGDFVDSLLEHVDIAEIWAGEDFAFGHKRSGTIDFLRERGEKDGFSVHIVTRQAILDEPISSTRVRELVEAGDVEHAAELLGHYAGLSGEVVRGHGRGRDLGFPTANIRYASTQTLPAPGIYAAVMTLNGTRHAAAVSAGYNPTFGEEKVVVEAYVLDFDRDVYGDGVQLDFVARIREEQAFDSIDALVAQMHRDVDDVRERLAVGG